MSRLHWRSLVAVAVTLTTVALYWAIGVSVGAHLVRGQMRELLAGTTAQTLALDQLRFNPFTMVARFEGLHLNDVNSNPVLTVASGHLRFAFTGLFSDAFSINDLFLERPNLTVAMSGPSGDRRLRSLGSLVTSNDNTRKSRPIHIAHATVNGGQITFFESAGSSSTPVGAHISELKVELIDWMSDAAEPAKFNLAAKLNDSGTLIVRGTWQPTSYAVAADVALTGLDLAKIARLFDTWPDDARLTGELAAQGQFRYRADSSDFDGELVVEHLSVRDTTGQFVSGADKLQVHGLKIGSGRWPATVQWVELDSPVVLLNVNEEGQLNTHRLNLDRLPRIEQATVRDGRVRFNDAHLQPSVQFDTDKISGEIIRGIDGSQETLTINFSGKVLEHGSATIGGVFRVNGDQVQAEGDAALSGVDAGIMSAYFSTLTAREINTGSLDLDLHYRKDGPGLSMFSKVTLLNLDLSAPLEGAPTFGLPLDLSIALLTDENHRMTFELPVTIASIDSETSVQQGFNDALKNLVSATNAEPIPVIARLAGVNVSDVDHIAFEAGGTEILPAAERKLSAWVNALAQRPLLGVRAQGRYSARIDRAALARRQVRLHIALAASTRTDKLSAQTELDFSDAKVQAVLDEFAVARLDTNELTRIKSGATERHDKAVIDSNPSYYPAVFEALAEKESVSDFALRQLARYRARALIDRLQELGIETQRLEIDKRAAATSDNAPATVALAIITPKRPTN